jgi:hypothetical protein
MKEEDINHPHVVDHTTLHRIRDDYTANLDHVDEH